MTILEKRVRNIVNNNSDPMFSKLDNKNKSSICRYFLYIIANLQISNLDSLEKYNNVKTIANYKINHFYNNERFIDILLNSVNL